MNLQKWNWWANLSPAKQTRVALAFIAVVVGAAYLTGTKATTEDLRETIRKKESEIHGLNEQIKTCEGEKTAIVRENAERDKEEDRREIEDLRAEGKRKDSITAKLNQALVDAQKAKRNAKR